MLKKAIFLSLFAFAFVTSASAAITPVTPSKDDTDGCYAIGSKEELYGFASLVNQGNLNICGKLVDNIVVNENVLIEGKLSSDSLSFNQWTPIGINAPFLGTFDGQGCTISGLYANTKSGNLGLFGFLANSVQIKNLKVVDSYISSTGYNNYVGGIVGRNTSDVLIDGVSFSGIVSGAYDVGGIIGYTVNAASLNDVSFSGLVSGSYNVGGIVGQNDRAKLTITKTSFHGSVKASDGYVGGIVGYSMGSYGSSYLRIANSDVSGSVESNAQIYVGGFVGYSSGDAEISSSQNQASVKGPRYVGGFVGYVYGEGLQLTKSFNSGDIVATESESYVGGLVGYFDRGSISNCYNVGSVSGNDYVGGLAGYVNAPNIAMFNSFCLGDVYGIGLKVGAIIGVTDGGSPFIDNVFYTGESGNQYGISVSKTVFENGVLANIMHEYSTPFAEGSVWGQNVLIGEAYPTLSGTVLGASEAPKGTLTLRFSNGSEESATYVEGFGGALPWNTADGKPIFIWSTKADFSDTINVVPSSARGEFVAYGKIATSLVFHTFAEDTETYPSWGAPGENLPKSSFGNYRFEGWYTSPEFTGEAVTSIPMDAGDNLEFYAKLTRIRDDDGCYLIATADDLYDFQGTVTYDPNACGKLTADIVYNENVLDENLDLNGDVGDYHHWFLIGSESYPFKGSFDGQGHVISGLVTSSTSLSYGGLFGYVSGSAVIKNVGVEDSYFQGAIYAGGIVAYVDAEADFTLTNSYSVAVVRVSGDGPAAGGLVGYLGTKNHLIANSFHIGSVSGAKQNGGLIGDGSWDHISNCYHDESTDPTNFPYVQSLNDGFKKGKVAAYLHNYNANSVDGSIWGQDPSKGDWHPNFSGKVVLPKAKVVYHLSDGTDVESTYNEGSDNALPTIVDGKEIIAWVKEDPNGYEAVSNIYSWNSGDLEFYGLIHSIKKVDGCYEISNGSELYEFAHIVSSEMNACGKLTKDIVVNENVLNADGSLNIENAKLRQWTPIGSWGNPFKGTFDGQGHSISGLYFKMETVEQYGSNRIGLFGYVESSDNETVSIKNLVVKDSYIWGYEYVGGIIGEARNVNLIVEACGFEGVVTAENSTAAGIIGYANETQMGSTTIVVRNSYNRGLLKSYDRVGGIIGATFVQTQVLNSYNMGTLEAQSSPSGQIIAYASNGASRLVENNFIIGSEDDDFGAAKSAEDFANGSVAELLHGYSENGVDGSIWGQDVVDGDEYPKFNGVVKKINIQKDSDGCYLIASADELYGFATIVNKGGTTACGKLTADIVVNEDVLDADGNLKNDISTYRLWKPIGFVDVESRTFNFFTGVFDGQGHTISGLVTDGSNIYEGLFGAVSSMEETTIIRNVGVVDSYIQGALVGSIAGVISGYSIVVENVYAETSVNGVGNGSSAGGIVAIFDGRETARLSNSYFAGSISGLNKKAIAYNCDVRAENNFFIGETDDDYGTAKSAEEFANGTVAELLHAGNSIWGQNVAKGDKYPNFSGKIEKALVLAWDDGSDNISSDDIGQYAEVTIEENKQFYANGKIYEGTLSAEDIAELKDAEAVLKPISGVALETAGDDTQAELSGSTETDKLIVPVEIRVAHIDIEREFKGTNSTLMVPFNVDNVDTNVKLIEVDTVYKDMELNAWVAEGTRVESIKAHTPYIINYTGKLSFDDVELVPNVSADTKVSFGNWTFVGAYEGKTWLADDPELGKAYGFSGVAKEGIAQGQFVRIGVNAKIAPMRAYLLYEKKDEAPAVAPKPDPDATTAVAAGESLPSSIILRVVDRKKDVVEEIIIDDVIQGLVGETQKSVEEKPVRWYDLKGRRLNSKPTARGTYIKNNKAVLNK